MLEEDSDATLLDGEDHMPAAHLVDRRGHLRFAYEPIADLARGTICGYEAVERFPAALTPDAWREASIRRGLERDFDAWAVASVLHARESLPAGCFLSFNMSPATLLHEPVQRVLARAGTLDGLVVELSPRVALRDEGRLAASVATLRAAGVRFAIDHVGGDDGVLRHAALIQPELVKLDGQLVTGLHRDVAKRTLLDGLGRLTSHFGASIVAQGVAHIEELDALLRLRVPHAQGPLIGVRAKTLTPVAFALSSYVRERGAAMLEPGSLSPLIEPLFAVAAGDVAAGAVAAAFAGDERLRWVALVDAHGRPTGLAEREAHARGESPAGELLVVTPSCEVAEVARRAMLRPAATRFEPLVCCDVDGACAGLVRVERLVEALAQSAST